MCFEFSPEATASLENLARSLGLTKVQVIQKALQLMALYQATTEDPSGRTFLAIRSQGQVHRLKISQW